MFKKPAPSFVFSIQDLTIRNEALKQWDQIQRLTDQIKKSMLEENFRIKWKQTIKDQSFVPPDQVQSVTQYRAEQSRKNLLRPKTPMITKEGFKLKPSPLKLTKPPVQLTTKPLEIKKTPIEQVLKGTETGLEVLDTEINKSKGIGTLGYIGIGVGGLILLYAIFKK